MQSVNLFELASQQAKWVTARQRAVANNIANVNTQGFTPSDVTPFKEVLGSKASAGALATTHTRHISAGGSGAGYQTVERERDTNSLESTNVSIEDELITAGEVRKAYEMNTAIVKAFHRMILTTVRK